MITVIIEVDSMKGVSQDKEGITIAELYECCKQAALACGFHPKTVEDYFEENQR